MIEVTEQQVYALEQAQTDPPRVFDPKTTQRKAKPLDWLRLRP
jgi:hypothetical protein